MGKTTKTKASEVLRDKTGAGSQNFQIRTFYVVERVDASTNALNPKAHPQITQITQIQRLSRHVEQLNKLSVTGFNSNLCNLCNLWMCLVSSVENA
jgi:hypothetical protein